jgi:hypothetical protein
MPLFEITTKDFRPIAESSFLDLKIKERDDLQRMLRSQIEVLGDDLYVLTEEFGEWEESRRRIDLLAIDRDANLVVIELKRTSDGGHMELQAIRYAAMVSTMTFERAEQIHAEFLQRVGEDSTEARSRMLAFLAWDEPLEDGFAQDVRILLVSEDFSKELTTAVIWLRDRDLDIRCIRLQPFMDGGRKLVNVQQIIPLPEASEYQIQIREKEQVVRKNRAERFDERLRFWQQLVAECHARKTRHGDRKPSSRYWLGAGAGKTGLNFNYLIASDEGMVELYIARGSTEVNKAIFDRLLADKRKIESVFGESLEWDRIDGKQASRIRHTIDLGGYASPEIQWPQIQAAMIDSMNRLEEAVLPVIDAMDWTGF